MCWGQLRSLRVMSFRVSTEFSMSRLGFFLNWWFAEVSYAMRRLLLVMMPSGRLAIPVDSSAISMTPGG